MTQMRPLTLRFATVALFATLAAAQTPVPDAPPDPSVTGTIEGTTFGAAHQPLAATSLILMPLPGSSPKALQLGNPYTAEADSLGRFSIDGVYPGTYTVLATHADYSPRNPILGPPNATMNARPADTITVAAGQHLTGVEIELVPMTVLSGRVTDENGDPVPRVTVRPMVVDTVLNGQRRLMIQGVGVQTDADGRYTMSVYSAHWFLRFVPAGSDTPESENGEPTLTRVTGIATRSVTEIETRSVTEIETRSVTRNPERGYSPTYFPGVRDVTLAAGFDAEGRPISELNVRMERTLVYHVRGNVKGPLAEKANPNLRILPSQEGGSLRPSVVDEGRPLAPDGTFDIAGLTAGTWTLILCQYGTPGSLGRQTVRITDADLEDVVIVPQPISELRGVAKTTPEQPVRNLLVRLTPLEALLSSNGVHGWGGEPSDDGAFTIQGVEAGRYRVDVTPPPAAYVKSVALNGQECLETGIDLTHGAASSGVLEIVLSTAAGRITGTVANPDGAPVSAARVTLLPDRLPGSMDRPELRPVVPTDATGHFSITGIAPGNYHVYAWERLDEVIASAMGGDAILFPDPQFPGLFDNLGAAVTIAENDSKQVSLSLISAAKMNDELRRHR